MRRARFAGVVLGVVLFIGPGLAGVRLGAQQLRQAWVRVADLTGAPITGLSADAFAVVEDGVKCRTLKAEPIEWPIKLTVMVDNGGKSSDYLLNLRNGLRGLFREVPGDIETSLLALAPQPRWLVRPIKGGEQLYKGVNLITPDAGAGKFFDGLLEAADRAAKDKAGSFPVFVAVISTFGNSNPPPENQYQRLQKELIDRAVTVHYVLMSASSRSGSEVTGAFQTNIGNQVASMTGGRYENIITATRLDTLLPEIGKQIADSAARQQYQYRLTYEAPKGAKDPKTVGVEVAVRGAVVETSADGHLP
jgi:hypothetical protein